MGGNFQNPFSEVRRRYARFKDDLPAIISNLASNTFKENFRRQGYEADTGGVVRWKKRAVVKGKADSSRGILTKSGRLRRGIRPSPQPGMARVVNSVPYAQVHNEGEKGTVRVKAHKRYQWKTGKIKGKGKTKTGKQRMKSVKTRVGVSRVKAYKRKMNMPARPFMITTKPLLHRIEKRVDLGLQALFK